MREKTKELILPLIQKFVSENSGEYLPHCSDLMLEQLLLWRFGQDYLPKENLSYAEAVIKGDTQAAYDAAQPILESVLERGCDVRRHGHHGAQKFNDLFIKQFAKKDEK
jgi:hypothetical protein